MRNYRVRGHNIAALDPLGLPRPMPAELETSFYGFSAEDMERPVHCDILQSHRTLKDSGNRPTTAGHLLPLNRRAVHAH